MPYLQLWYYVVEIFLLLFLTNTSFPKNDFKVTVYLKTKEFAN